MNGTGAKGRVLVVDHNEDLLRSLASHLVDNSYDVATATSSNEALEMASEQDFDLVLMDMWTPLTTGTETVTQLRESFTRAELPIIINSTSQTTTDIVGALTAGANDYVTKDVDLRILLARIETNISLKKTNEQFIQTNRVLVHGL